jgi:hypothetical protein
MLFLVAMISELTAPSYVRCDSCNGVLLVTGRGFASRDMFSLEMTCTLCNIRTREQGNRTLDYQER